MSDEMVSNATGIHRARPMHTIELSEAYFMYVLLPNK